MIVIACILSVAIVVRGFCILSKQKIRRGEFIHHVRMIHSEHGCADAMRHYHACKRIVEHYDISITSISGETGFHGDMVELMIKATQSEVRAEIREAEQMGHPVSGSKHGHWRTGAVYRG